MALKVHGHQIFDFRFFSSISFPSALIVGFQPFLIFMNIDGDIQPQRFLSDAKDTAEKF